MKVIHCSVNENGVYLDTCQMFWKAKWFNWYWFSWAISVCLDYFMFWIEILSVLGIGAYSNIIYGSNLHPEDSNGMGKRFFQTFLDCNKGSNRADYLKGILRNVFELYNTCYLKSMVYIIFNYIFLSHISATTS